MGFQRFFRRKSWDEERALELDAYLEQESADNIARGMTPDEARRAAQLKLGNATSVREEIYRMNTLGFLETFWQDVRYGLRVLRKSPGLTSVALLSLALGIGATTAIFSVVYGVLISPYPYAKANEIWAPEIRNAKNPKQFRGNYRVAEYLQVSKLPAFAQVMATSPENRLLTGNTAPETFTTVTVTASAFPFLDVPPLLGRTIAAGDVRPNGEPEPVIVLSYLAWQRLFQGSADALGKTVTLNDVRYSVIGVMPPRFGWWTSDGGWLPMSLDPRQDHPMFAIARLRPGVSAQAAEQQLQALHLELAKARPEDFPKEGFNTVLRNYLDITVAQGEMQSSLQLLFGAVGFLLLIACANVANLQLARATARRREIALRMSVGAGAARVVRQLLTESVALALAGGALGILFAYILKRAIESLMPEFYVPNEARIEVNGKVLAFSGAISAITGIVFGLAPALQCARLQLVDTLKDSTMGAGTSAAGKQPRNLLVIAEVALAVVLLMGASLTIRGFVELQRTDVGFQADRVLMVGLSVPPKRYATYEQRVALTESDPAACERDSGCAIGGHRQWRTAVRRSPVHVFVGGSGAGARTAHSGGADQRGLSAHPRHSSAGGAGTHGVGSGARGTGRAGQRKRLPVVGVRRCDRAPHPAGSSGSARERAAAAGASGTRVHGGGSAGRHQERRPAQSGRPGDLRALYRRRAAGSDTGGAHAGKSDAPAERGAAGGGAGG